jgi:hypothetical protein
MHELQQEKNRLQLELVKKEAEIKANYRHILSAFSLRNIFTTVTTELSNPSSITAKVITLGKNWLSRRKKKKKEAKNKHAEEKAGETVKSEE